MNYNRLTLFLALVSWQGFTRWLGFAIPARWVLGFAIPLLLLTACDADRHERMQQELLRARKMNKEYVDFTTDSVMKEVADYYDRHGTPNERMEAHYLLGCAYRDMGEAPRAVDCYLDAVACADTTAADCDFYTMSGIYGQLATLYHQQLLLSYEVEAYRQAYRCDLLAGDTLSVLFDKKMIAGAYILRNKRDSAEMILNEVISLYRERGYEQEALQTSTMLMNLLIDSLGRQAELKQIIDLFDTKYKLFDENHELPTSARQFYYYKGAYFENASLLDSAEYYYRKSYNPERGSMAHERAYKGLLSVFSKLGQYDSIAKYARLYCEVNDSTVARKDQDITAQMAASYNYNHYQKEAQENERKAYKANLRLLIVSLSLLAIAAFTAILIYHYRRQRRKQQAKYIVSITERAKLQEELESLHAKDYDAVIARKEEEIAHLSQIIAEHEATYQGVMSKEKLTVFGESAIVKLFAEKSNFRKANSDISSTEWEELVREFSQDMPLAYSLLKGLSTLQLHVCILLLLDYEESVIAVLKNTKPQTINNAKARANQKLFQSGDSASLKSNLRRIIVA